MSRREYDAVVGFRNRGGNLMFLSANNFFWRTVISHNRMTRVAKWRDVGRPEAALIGIQYIGNDNGTHRDAYHVRNTQSAPWLFAGTNLTIGSTFSSFGIEIDKIASSSPRGTHVLAVLPNLLGPGRTGPATTSPSGRPRPQIVLLAAMAFGRIAGGMRSVQIEWIDGLQMPFAIPLTRTAKKSTDAPTSSGSSQRGAA